MCGLSGIFASVLPQNAGNTIAAMAGSLKHRGPDKTVSQVYPDLGLALGHNRLRILDLDSRSDQPMWDSSGQYALVFNGEIYNYLELKQDLMESGASFHTTSDTEVLLKLLIREGHAALDKLRGMWAFAFFDRFRNTLLLARDCLGKKPLYYAVANGALYFASEPKALCRAGVAGELNHARIARYLAWNYRMGEWDTQSFFSEIQSIPAGCALEVDRDLNLGSVWNWKPEFTRYEGTKDEAASHLVALLQIATQQRMRADVDVAAMVSGGLDSTSVAALAAPLSPRPLRLFSGVTGSLSGIHDESSWVLDLASYLGKTTPHFTKIDLLDLERNLRRMIHSFDEPAVTVSFLPLFLIYEQISRQGTRVVLTGHGGDEVFAGYWSHYSLWFSLLNDDERQVAMRHYSERFQRQAELDAGHAGELQANPSKYPEYESVLGDLAGQLRMPVSNRGIFATGLDCLNTRLLQEVLFEHIPPVVKAEDRVSMAFSVESRCPFLDRNLLEASFAVPGWMKMTEVSNKSLLRQGMKGRLPRSILERADKVGLDCPFGDWIRQEFKDFTYDQVMRGKASRSLCLKRSELDRLWQEHQAGKNHAQFFWQMLQVNLWMEELEL